MACRAAGSLHSRLARQTKKGAEELDQELFGVSIVFLGIRLGWQYTAYPKIVFW